MPNDNNNTKNQGIPSWQRAQSQQESEDARKQDDQDEENNDEQKEPEHSDLPAPSASEQRALVEAATTFLQDESIQDAPTEEKVAFLKAKGMSDESIQKAIADAAITTKQPEPSPPQHQPAQTASPLTQPTAIQPRPSPPIITYPEFLQHKQTPSPLVTGRRLLYTGYVASTFAALAYGLSRYLVTPMTDSLTASRHDLHAHAQSKLSALLSALESVVSTPTPPHPSVHFADDDDADAASTYSDPTELFHRDFGTQTSPALSPAPRAASPSSSSSAPDTDGGAAGALHHLQKQLAALTQLSAPPVDVSASLKMLTEQVQTLSYASPSITASTGGGWLFDTSRKKDDDGGEVARMKAEIRSVKGVLLSARNFPGAGSAGLRRGA